VAKVSLIEFAKANPQHPTGVVAWITTIPEWPVIHEAWTSGTVRQSHVRNWLIEECGYAPEVATRNRIAHLSRQYPRTNNG
jgi:hypothetical protein